MLESENMCYQIIFKSNVNYLERTLRIHLQLLHTSTVSRGRDLYSKFQ